MFEDVQILSNCSICDKKNVRLEAHEDWEYDYENSIQKLNDIKALCRMCHLNSHLGFSRILIREGKLKAGELIGHWCKVNNEREEKFKEYEGIVFNLWSLRNKFNWKIVDKNGHNIYRGLHFDDLLSSLK